MSTKVAIVTGSNKGIGLAIVRALCKEYQGDVYLTSRDVSRGEDAVKTLAADGLKATFHQLDINDVNSIAAAAAYFKDKYGGVDVLVNNAAIAFKEADPAPFAVQAEVTLKTNFFATRDMLTHFLPLIKAGGKDADLDPVDPPPVLMNSSVQGCRTRVWSWTRVWTQDHFSMVLCSLVFGLGLVLDSNHFGLCLDFDSTSPGLGLASTWYRTCLGRWSCQI
ncbi:carbonyl reductase [NADPH] 1 [Etheostoma cragini]|uniref:carbonyl reductase [NADPH] 1 n=1 Tax=Etheostoma cragini TaxID=417921 RepID=UPI00155E8407|nr:carbonyl reductase [NADPH] 1 [Etheostoma cragini]